MHYITSIMFWISNSLLIPVIVGLLLLFFLSILLLGNLFAARRRHQQLVRRYAPLMHTLEAHAQLQTLQQGLEKDQTTPGFPQVARSLFSALPEKRTYLVNSYELQLQKRNTKAMLLTKFGPILGLMGTLIPMGPALVDLSTGAVAGMAYNMQVAFATTVLGMFAAAIGYIYLQKERTYHQQELIWLDYLTDTLNRQADAR